MDIKKNRVNMRIKGRQKMHSGRRRRQNKQSKWNKRKRMRRIKEVRFFLVDFYFRDKK